MTLLLQCSSPEHVIMVIAKATTFVGTTADAAHALGELAIPAYRREMVSATFPNLPSTLGAGNQKAHIVMVLAQPFYGRRNATNYAFLLWVSTLLAQVFSVLCRVILKPNLSTAIIAPIRKHNSLSDWAPIVMVNTKSVSEMRLTANLAECSGSVDKVVFGLITAKFKVFYSVIVSNLIDVMNFLLGLENPSKVLLHDKAMLPNVSPVVAIGMVRELYSDVSILVLIFLSGLSVWCFTHKGKDFTFPS